MAVHGPKAEVEVAAAVEAEADLNLNDGAVAEVRDNSVPTVPVNLALQRKRSNGRDAVALGLDDDAVG